MCEFISWIEYKGQVLFLDKEKLASRRGKELKEYDKNADNWKGHGAICWYYGINRKDCIQKEVTDLSDPSAFPLEIVEALKHNLFSCFMPDNPKGLLSPKSWEEYDKVEKLAWEEHDKVEKLAWEEYEKVRKPAREEYDKVRKLAWKEYDKVTKPAWEEYDNKIKTLFWDLFSIKENRAKAWK